MTQIFKNVRVLLCALALSASVHGVAPVQAAAAASPTPTATPTFGSFGGGRRLTFVTREGNFKIEFKSFSEALEASQGNSGNQMLKKGSEIIVMNARCGDGIFGDKVTFSMYALSKDVEPLVKSFLDFRPPDPNIADDLVARSARGRALTAEIMRLVAVASPRKADCDAVPVALALSTSEMLRLEVDDAQSPLIGVKINDGFLYDTLMQSTRFLAVAKSKRLEEQRAFWEKYSYNRFPTAQDALNASLQQAGTKVLIYNGTNFSLYRISGLYYESGASDAKRIEALKTTPIRKGWKIVALVAGNEFTQIYNPNVKK